MRSRALIVLIAVLLGLPVLAATAQEASPVASPGAGGSGLNADLVDYLNLTLANLAATCPGGVLYLDSPQGQFFEAAGVADRQTQGPLDRSAPFEIGSNTKMMTAAIILQLQEAGALSLDDTLDKWFPEQATALEFAGPITIRELLNHTSGLYDYVEDLASGAFIGLERTGDTSQLTQAWTPQQLLDYVVKYRNRNVYFAPGAEGQWHYSNTNYLLLGLIIEQATGGSYADALQTRIFDPLGLHDTHLLNDSPAPGEVGSSGYYFDHDTTAWNLSQAWAAGAVVSTPQDLATFMRALLAGTLFTHPETLALMQEGVDTPLGSYGLGLIEQTPGVWGHGGQTLGFESAVSYNQAADAVLVAWANCAPSGVESLSYSIPVLAG